LSPETGEGEILGALQDPWVRSKIAGSIPRPGGNDATGKAADLAGLQRGWRVFDADCGRGGTPVLLAQQIGCSVLGLTPDPHDAALAREEAMRQKVTVSVTIAQGDALSSPPQAGEFDAVFLECTLSRSKDRPGLLASVVPGLKSGGKLVIADISVEEDLPSDAGRFIAMAGLGDGIPTFSTYTHLVEFAGLTIEKTLALPDVLPSLLERLSSKIGVAEIALRMGVLPITPQVFFQLKALLHSAQRLADEGVILYSVLVAKKAAE